jgi:hypothetical protein
MTSSKNWRAWTDSLQATSCDGSWRWARGCRWRRLILDFSCVAPERDASAVEFVPWRETHGRGHGRPRHCVSCWTGRRRLPLYRLEPTSGRRELVAQAELGPTVLAASPVGGPVLFTRSRPERDNALIENFR